MARSLHSGGVDPRQAFREAFGQPHCARCRLADKRARFLGAQGRGCAGRRGDR